MVVLKLWSVSLGMTRDMGGETEVWGRGWIFAMDARTKASTCVAHDRGRLHSALSVGLAV